MSKVRFTFRGVKFDTPLNKHYDGTSYAVDPVTAGKMVKQYCKAKYPDLLVRVKSDSFAGGNSLDVWVTNQDGSPVSEDAFADIRHFASLWQEGSFDGMIDLYEYNDDTYTATTADGEALILKPYTKYVMTNNRARFDTPESIEYGMKHEGRTYEHATRYVSPNTIKQWKKKFAA